MLIRLCFRSWTEKNTLFMDALFWLIKFTPIIFPLLLSPKVTKDASSCSFCHQSCALSIHCPRTISSNWNRSTTFLQEQEDPDGCIQVDLLVLRSWISIGCLDFTIHMNFVLFGIGCLLCQQLLAICPLFPQYWHCMLETCWCDELLITCWGCLYLLLFCCGLLFSCWECFGLVKAIHFSVLILSWFSR